MLAVQPKQALGQIRLRSSRRTPSATVAISHPPERSADLRGVTRLSAVKEVRSSV